MKHAKKLLALLLALVIGLGLGALVLAEDEESAAAVAAQAINLDDFYITKDLLEDITVKNGEEFTLRVEANVPEGLTENVQIVYNWYLYNSYNWIRYECYDGIYKGQANPDFFLDYTKQTIEFTVGCNISLVEYGAHTLRNLHSQKITLSFDWDDYWNNILNDFRIVKQPQDLTVKYGDDFILNVDVNIPENFPEELYLRYDWLSSEWHSSLLNAGLIYQGCAIGSDYATDGGKVEFFCEITVYDYRGNPIKILKSDTVTVTATLPIDDFYIIKQPKSVKTKYEQHYTLNFEVNIPEDLPEDARVQYRWYVDDSFRSNNKEYLGKISGNADKVYCEATFMLRVAGKDIPLKTLTSQVVTVRYSLWGRIQRWGMGVLIRILLFWARNFM